MNSTVAASAACFKQPTRSVLPPPPNSSNPNPPRIQYKYNRRSVVSTRSLQISADRKQLTPPAPSYSTTTVLSVAEKLDILVSEFKSLTEPIDRVKRLIHYASLLPELEESGKVESNRVTGCTAQVWLEVVMDVQGSMRFRVDSDSEITKGFCYCLIWLLDGAAAGDVIEIRVDDLGEMNVGILPIRASSRVNTWHNVLISMQRRTRALIDHGDLRPGDISSSAQQHGLEEASHVTCLVQGRESDSPGQVIRFDPPGKMFYFYTSTRYREGIS